jgi:hypothetical protein
VKQAVVIGDNFACGPGTMLWVVEQPDSTAKAALAASRERPLMIFLFILFDGVRVIGSASETLSEQSRATWRSEPSRQVSRLFLLAKKSVLVIFRESTSTKSPRPSA